MVTTVPAPDAFISPVNPRAGASTQAAPAATLERVTRRYGPVTALDGVSLAIDRGGVTALLGPNGAGKTTAVRLILGVARPDAGHVAVFGRNPQDRFVRVRVGTMLQVSRVPQTLRVIEHLRLFSSYYPSPLPLGDVIALAGLAGLERRSFGTLSGGQQQRLLFGLAICGNPDLLVLDEPTSSLDVESRRTMWRVIRAYADRGTGVLLTTHDLDEAESLAEHVVVLDRGRVIREGSPASLAADVAQSSITCVSSLAVSDVLALPGVLHAELVGRTLRVQTSQPERTAAALIGADATLADLQIARASLEDAFLAITARRGVNRESPNRGLQPR